MRFINPKTDYAFKKIFGSNQSKEILISFLNAILYHEKEVIQDLEILNPYSPGASFGLKDTYLDVKAKLDNDTTVLIEMQVLNKYAFDKRVMYNAAKSYANQLDSGERYILLNPVIALTIVDFIMFDNNTEIINSFVFQEEKQKFVYNEEIKLVFLELRKFNKSLEELETISDKWIYFIKNAAELREKPADFQSVSALNQALEIANLAGLNREELEEIQNRTIWLTDQEGITLYAQEKGREEGIIEGKIKGKIELIITLLQQKLGEISLKNRQKIETLSSQEIDVIIANIFNINSWEDLENMLNTNQ
ncbi:Rpn family recombination-promoting nuclease/putative transposase [Crocosphaera sp.]|uniref:Rpn family recombination-promoting nuclease/putative transposase n=1 Tax=Crocosphaera sp. TaxID=2729996 RepID=UPI0026254970|nr:Rpn family recombination-promoting nuclease/putative transposase [Crocosphaera sp.]MDJ0583272.1 Rpn family recombination-promoting nuclease/putative transposase [Crocosphaera sp.]